MQSTEGQIDHAENSHAVPRQTPGESAELPDQPGGLRLVPETGRGPGVGNGAGQPHGVPGLLDAGVEGRIGKAGVVGSPRLNDEHGQDSPPKRYPWRFADHRFCDRRRFLRPALFPAQQTAQAGGLAPQAIASEPGSTSRFDGVDVDVIGSLHVAGQQLPARSDVGDRPGEDGLAQLVGEGLGLVQVGVGPLQVGRLDQIAEAVQMPVEAGFGVAQLVAQCEQLGTEGQAFVEVLRTGGAEMGGGEHPGQHGSMADPTGGENGFAAQLDPAGLLGRVAQELHGQMAVRLYRDEFDYRSMVILQFNVAASERALGEDAIAVDALVAAIQMDLEYGFRDDAKENYRQLLAWKIEKGEAQRIAALIEATSPRIVKFKFGWTSGASSMQIETSRRGLIHGQIVDSHTLGTLHRLVTASSHGLKVAFDSGNAPYELGVWPSPDGSRGCAGCRLSACAAAIPGHGAASIGRAQNHR